MGERRCETAERRRAPGPGQYDPKPVTPSSPGVSFGKGKRDLIGLTHTRDYRTSYLDIFSSANARKKNNKGFTFANQSLDVSTMMNAARAIPGPGHYRPNEGAVKPRPTSISISTENPLAGIGSSQGSGDVQFIDPPSSLACTGYQKFAQAGRFPSQSSVSSSRYRRIIFGNTSAGVQPIIKRNMALAGRARKESRLKRIAKYRTVLESRIVAAQKAKERIIAPPIATPVGIEQEEISSQVCKQQEATRRRLVSKEKSSTWKLMQSWLAVGTLGGMLEGLVDKYNLKKAVKKRTDKLMRILFVCLWSVGRFVLRGRKMREQKILRCMHAIVTSCRGMWRMRRRIRMKRRMVKFVDNASATPQFVVFVMVVVCRIRLIQKWFRRYLVKRRLLLAIMNRQWSAIEYAVLKLKKDPRSLTEKINYCIETRQKGDVVPIHVRTFFIRQYLSVPFLPHAHPA